MPSSAEDIAWLWDPAPEREATAAGVLVPAALSLTSNAQQFGPMDAREAALTPAKPASTASCRCLWTACLDYFSMEEGRSLMACITHASSENEVRTHFGRTFGQQHSEGCDIQNG